MTLGKLPPRRHVQHDPSLFQLLHVELEPVMVKRDQHVHLRLGAADPLIRNIQLIARVAALYELWRACPKTHIPWARQGHRRAIGKPALLPIGLRLKRDQTRTSGVCNSIPFTSCEAPNSNVKLPHAVSKG